MKKLNIVLQVIFAYLMVITKKEVRLIAFWTKFLFSIKKITKYTDGYVGMRPYAYGFCVDTKMGLINCQLMINRERDTYRPGAENNNFRDAEMQQRDWNYYSYFFSLSVRLLNSRTYNSIIGKEQFGNVNGGFFIMVRDWQNTKQRWMNKLRKINFGVIDLFKAIEMAKQAADSEVHQHLVCSDPMNGCPGDFSEGFSRNNRRKECEYDALRVPEAMKTWLLGYFHDKAWEQYHMNRAPWDTENEYENYVTF
jgi:hypothetical protein